MDPTSHIPQATLFHSLIHAMQLSESERRHLDACGYCQAIIEEWETYIDPGMVQAA
jgi:hypothetical protein